MNRKSGLRHRKLLRSNTSGLWQKFLKTFEMEGLVSDSADSILKECRRHRIDYGILLPVCRRLIGKRLQLSELVSDNLNLSNNIVLTPGTATECTLPIFRLPRWKKFDRQSAYYLRRHSISGLFSVSTEQCMKILVG